MASVAGRLAAYELRKAYPWTSIPLIIGAPMRLISGPAVAVAISSAGGLGFIGPGAHPADLDNTLSSIPPLLEALPTSSALRQTSSAQSARPNALLPVGIGFQTWASDLATTTRIMRVHPPPVAAWLFAPRHGQKELDEWTAGIRAATHGLTKIWIQVASVKDAEAAATSNERPDVLVVQGSDAGGHSRTKGAGLMTLLPEIADTLNDAIATATDNKQDNGRTLQPIPLVAAGGIIDSRGVVSAAALGAAGFALGTRFLASHEANINPGYVRHVLSATDGGQTTVRTQLYNHLRGTTDWPAEFDARGLANASWRDYEAGVPFEALKERHADAVSRGEEGWGEAEGRVATYAGTGVGLVRERLGAADIVREIRRGVQGVMDDARITVGEDRLET